MNKSQERRSSIRRPIHHEAILHLGKTHHVPCVIADYCPDGMFLKFDREYIDFLAILRKEDLLDLSFKDLRGKEFHIGAHLAHMMTGAFGIRFTERKPQAIRALVAMNQGARSAPSEESKKIVEECIERIHSTTLPLMTDLWPVLIEEIKQASIQAQSDQKANELMAAAEKVEKSQRELQAGFSIGVQDPLGAYQEHLDMSTKMSDTLSLVDKGDFEDWLTSRVLITKCETQYRAELLPLKVRLDAVGIGDKNHHQSVFGPALLVSAFHAAVIPLRLGGTLEKLVFKVFEKQVMTSLDSLYLGLNQILVNHNILPNMDLAKAVKSRAEAKPKRSKPEPSQEKRPQEQENSAQGGSAGGPGVAGRPGYVPEASPMAASLESQASLATSAETQQNQDALGAPSAPLEEQRSSFIESLGGGTGQADTQSAALTAPPFQSASSPSGAAPGLGTLSGQANQMGGDSPFQQNQAEVQSALNNVVGLMRSLRKKSAEQSQRLGEASAPLENYSQGEFTEGLAELQGASDADKLEERPSLMSRVEESFKQQGTEKALDEQQKVAIDVVDRFFYSMRNNPRISSEAKQHLLKLEVPVLKVLLKDERFFEDHNSSVRAVMNRIAQLGAKGATLNPASRRKVSELVEQIVEQFEQDTEIFDSVLAELDQLIEKQNKLYVKNVERVAAAADGVHKVDEAKVAVATALNQRFAGKQVPSAVSVLVENGWKELLNLTHIKYGEDSEQWHTYLSVLDRLIAFGDNPEIPVDAKKIIPVIQEGLKQVSGTNEASGTVRESLKHLIQNAPRGCHNMVQAKLQDLPETEDDLVQRNLTKSQELKTWILKAKSIETGTWLQLEREGKEPQYMRLVWIAKGYSKFVCVNHQGMKVIELGLLKFATYLRDRRISLDFDYELPMVNQSLDNMVAEVYDKIAYESNYDEGSGLIRKSEFCRQVRTLMKKGKRTAECYLLYIRFYDTKTDDAASLEPSFAKDVAGQLSGMLGGGVLGRVNDSDFVLFTVDHGEEFLGLRCQDTLETLCESEETALSVLIGESKAHMGFYNPESMIRAALELIEESFARIHQSDEGVDGSDSEYRNELEDEFASDGVRVNEPEPVANSDNIPTLYIDESENILPEDIDFSALTLELKMQVVECLNNTESEADASSSNSVLQNHVNLSCFVEGGQSPFEVSGDEDAKELDAWWIAQLIALQAHQHPVLDDENYVRVQISGYSLCDEEFTEQMLSLSRAGKIPARKVCFDLYDCAAIEDIHSAVAYMNQLKAEGFKFCLDHFGSERSPFAFLKALPFDMIKIDESFMEELNQAEGDEKAADSIIEIAHYLGKKVLANAVDTAICLQKMKHLKVDFVQGSSVSAYIDL
ncbi:hypothetical protein A3741_06640 [Oleiphilus sp. HI0069]|uniref:DUF1631 family protein n=5 Tax=unclassified Oleiphilus TaxID=2631174 RepID=UPI0007C408B5|nr:DUF1631 family protein [Oleiphilus sp. HI0132]KZY79595.1 hypothetical protein A3741_06640 [Oleiphilus sp. HI0069]KZZ72076.1 hypothetical protein A3766_00880 [Oleiphilus sp. HI0132]